MKRERGYGRNRYKKMSQENRQILKEYQKHYHEVKKST